MPIPVLSELSGVVQSIEVQVGTAVAEGDTVAILDSMKMEILVAAPASGTVASIDVAVGDSVTEGQKLLSLEQ